MIVEVVIINAQTTGNLLLDMPPKVAILQEYLLSKANIYINEFYGRRVESQAVKRCFYYLFENCGARRAALSPYFFLSFIRGSRVRNPDFLSVALYSGSA